MDRSILSDAKVVEATRNFVCMRLATYEDAEEAKYLRKIYIRNGELENTVFAVLAPDGKTPLSRAGRRPSFRSASQMAQSMDRMIREDYPHAVEARWKDQTLPEVKNLDLGINVASCDGLPVVVSIGKDKSELSAMKKKLLPLAWNKDLAGQVVFTSALANEDLSAIGGLDERNPTGIYVLAPGQFGMSAKKLAKLSNSNAEVPSSELAQVLAKFQPPAKDHRQHVKNGVLFGLRWETAIPVTDRQAAMAAERLWGK